MKSEQKKKKNEQMEWQESCTKELPGFLSQLLLLMNSGLVLSDAFLRIADGYGSVPETQQTLFMKEICRICQRAARTGESPVRLFCQFSQNSGVRELARVAGILEASLETGADLWEKLAEQSAQLWENRKRLALEKIRVGESKMSFPLGILMIALLLVTAAPAMLQL